MTLLQRDLELIDAWVEHGMPANDSTRAHAVTLLVQLFAENRELHEIISQLTGPAEVTEYQLCALTEDNTPDWDVWTVWVTRHWPPHGAQSDTWVVRSMFEVVDPATGEWVYDPHRRGHHLYARPLGEALRLAEQAQWTLQVNGKTAADILGKQTGPSFADRPEGEQ